MIREETVFVLGAGASAPYGFPVGERLLQLIKLELDFISRPDCINKYVEAYQLYGERDIVEEEFKSFLRDLEKSDPSSIDQFLATETKEKYVQLGKYIIAYILNNHDTLNQSKNQTAAEQHWYGLLKRKILEGFSKIKTRIIFEQQNVFYHL